MTEIQITSLTPLDFNASWAEMNPGTWVSEQAGVKGPDHDSMNEIYAHTHTHHIMQNVPGIAKMTAFLPFNFSWILYGMGLQFELAEWRLPGWSAISRLTEDRQWCLPWGRKARIEGYRRESMKWRNEYPHVQSIMDPNQETYNVANFDRLEREKELVFTLEMMRIPCECLYHFWL